MYLKLSVLKRSVFILDNWLVLYVHLKGGHFGLGQNKVQRMWTIAANFLEQFPVKFF